MSQLSVEPADYGSIAILGRQPELGAAELEALFGSDRISILNGNHSAARLAIDAESIDFSRLGGTVKLCRYLATADTTDWKDIEQCLHNYIPAFLEQIPSGKFRFGISVYGFTVQTHQVAATGFRIKKLITTKGRPVRYIPNNSLALNSAQVIHNKLTGPNGCEFVLARDGTQTVIAQTIAVQNIQSYGLRDYGRPKRDARVGMLPPKLAQIILNLAAGPLSAQSLGSASRSNVTVLDPFCGTGVVLQEAMLMGYQAYGTDIDPRMIAYSRSNLEWLASHTGLPVDRFRLSSADATNFHWPGHIDMVASELYLGRPFTTSPSAKILAQTIADCNLITKKFLLNIHDQLQTGARLCLAVPAWHADSGSFYSLPLIDRLEDMGYNLVHFQYVKPAELIYFRKDQIVARQLLTITRK